MPLRDHRAGSRRRKPRGSQHGGAGGRDWRRRSDRDGRARARSGGPLDRLHRGASRRGLRPCRPRPPLVALPPISKDDPGGPMVEGRSDQVACAPGRGQEAGSFGRGGPRASPEADAISTTAVDPSPSIPNRAVRRSSNGPRTSAETYRPPVAEIRASDRALTAVGHRHKVDDRPGPGPIHAESHRSGSLGGSEATFEFVGGEDDLHAVDCSDQIGPQRRAAVRSLDESANEIWPWWRLFHLMK